MPDLSILIPARSEMFLKRTIDDILANLRGDTEIIAVLDGEWADPAIPQHARVHVIHVGESIGQRAATNLAAKLSSAKYVMKCDAHCAFDEGFDVKLMADMQPNWTMIPRQYNLHAFDWVCQDCQARTYQGPKKCGQCQSENVVMEVVWQPRWSRLTTSWRFDRELHFQYWGAYNKRPEGQAEISDTMSCLGACWLMERDYYWQIGGMDENHGSWGQMGTELGCKTWLSGGRMVCNKHTWFAHLFRTQPGFGFPYPLSSGAVERARKYSQDLWLNDKWPLAERKLSWLVEHFAPVPGWEDYTPASKPKPQHTALYYTCNTHNPVIEQACRVQLSRARGDGDLVTVSLNQVIDYGDIRLVVQGERGAVQMHRQILEGLRACKSRFVYLCESDVLYHPSHFEFSPRRDDVFYYNVNVWRLRFDDGLAVWTDNLQQVSGCCASRELLLDFYTRRLAQIENDGFNRHFEPGIKQTVYPRARGGKYGVENWQSEYPNVCIRHDANLTRSKWSPDEFRDPKYAAGWNEAQQIPGWGVTANRVIELLNEVQNGR